jgi:transposase
MDTALDNLPDDPETLKAMLAELLSANINLQSSQAALEAKVTALHAANTDMQSVQTALEAQVAALHAANIDRQARIDRLQLLLRTIQRATYGKSSEKLDESQYAFAFEEVQTALGEIEAQLERLEPKQPRPSSGRRALPAHLERVEEVVEPEAGACACGSCARVKIGEDVTERLDVIAPKFRVIVTRRPRYACTACRENIVQAPAPAHLIEGGLPTERLLASIAVSKYADGLPLYRQEAIYAREKVELGRNLMANWMGHVGFHLEPLAERLFEHVRAGERIFADETTLPILSPGRGKTKTGYLWTYLRDDRSYGGSGPPIVVYRFEDSRRAECLERHLAGWSGLLQCDGYAAYRKLAETDRPGGAATLACCWSHLRREFFKLHADGSSQVATWTVERMAELWAVEARVKGQDPQARLEERQKISAPVVLELQSCWENELSRISGKSKLAEAIRYGLTRTAEFGRFLEDGRIELDNNSVERAIRPQTITRKNALFAGSEAGGHTWATIASLLATARLNDVDPNAWLTQALERIAQGWPNKNIDDLLPWNFKAK